MVKVNTQIEIAATPEECWKVFFDFEHWHEMKNDTVQSITRLPGASGPVLEGEKLDVVFTGGLKSQVVVKENSPDTGIFTWRGDMFYVLSGDHTFKFVPSETTPGGTTLYHSEIFARLNTILMRFMSPEKMWEQLNVDFKTRVEKLKAEGKL